VTLLRRLGVLPPPDAAAAAAEDGADQGAGGATRPAAAATAAAAAVCRCLGVTAAPFRRLSDERLERVFDTAVWGPSIGDLCARGVLVPPLVFGPSCAVDGLTPKVCAACQRCAPPCSLQSRASSKTLHIVARPPLALHSPPGGRVSP
jgi:hypothetical protein